MRGGISKLKLIGDALWGCGGDRSVVRREGKNSWHYFTPALPPREDNGPDAGFDDIDGFSEQDIYAVGGNGDVWHYDGKIWQQLALPGNMFLHTVCCAADGNVYIGAMRGAIFKGRGNSWELISQGTDMTLPLRDMVWYQDKLWCTSDYGLWWLEKDQLKEAEVPTKVYACAGNLSVADGVLLVAGAAGAALFNGSDWQMIVDFDDLA